MELQFSTNRICYNYLYWNRYFSLERSLESIEIARSIVESVSEKQADNIVLLDIRNISSFADYFVICSAESDRQIKAICEEISRILKENGVISHHTEGSPDSGWVLVDLGEVIVHVFSVEQRQHYNLDDFWVRATPIVRIQ